MTEASRLQAKPPILATSTSTPCHRHLVLVLADAEANDKQRNQLCDHHNREDLQTDRVPQFSLVGQHFGHYAQAAHGQDPRQRKRTG